MRTNIVAIAIAIAGACAQGSATAGERTTVPLTIRCFEEAADRQQIDRRVLWGLFATEGGWVGSSIQNANGSHDLGPMQINDAWLPTIARNYFDGDQARAREAVQYNGCYNAQISAWIFKKNLEADGGNLPLAVKHYNSHTPEHMERYGQMFTKRFIAMWGLAQTRTAE